MNKLAKREYIKKALGNVENTLIKDINSGKMPEDWNESDIAELLYITFKNFYSCVKNQNSIKNL